MPVFFDDEYLRDTTRHKSLNGMIFSFLPDLLSATHLSLLNVSPEVYFHRKSKLLVCQSDKKDFQEVAQIVKIKCMSALVEVVFS